MIRWLLGGTAAAIAIGWVVALCHAHGLAPAIIASLVVGVVLGVALSYLATALRIVGTRRLVAGTFLLALLTVVAQHAWLYGEFRRQWHQSRADLPQVAMFRDERPLSPRTYFNREATPRRVMLWFVDAAFITGVATCIVLATRPPTILPTPDP